MAVKFVVVAASLFVGYKLLTGDLLTVIAIISAIAGSASIKNAGIFTKLLPGRDPPT